jgi:ACS family tartrate transporter-like MFS transporter
MSVSTESFAKQRAARHIAGRLLPFLFILYVIAFLDRVNVSYAALKMSHELGFSDSVFGFGAGMFFVGYLLRSKCLYARGSRATATLW